jgi:hypothetical protein
VDIAGGTLKIDGDYRTQVAGWESAGRMIAEGGALGWSLDVIYAGGITTVTAKPPSLITVPDVTGLEQAAAEAVLVSSGLVAGVISTVIDIPDDGFEVGEVFSQDPSGGSSAALGEAVDLTLVVAAAVPVPDVVGLDQAAAESAIVSAGLSVGAVTSVADEPGDDFEVGDVFSQYPAAGAEAEAGSAVTLAVVIAPPVVDLPAHDVNGDGLDDLIHIADNNGLFSVEVLLFGGTSYSQWALSGVAADHASLDKWFSGDFNGDGKTDAARLFGNTGGDIRCEVETTLADGSLNLVQWGSALNYTQTARWFSGDFNGDGKDDLLEMPYDGTTLTLNVFRSIGSLFLRSQWWTSAGSRAEQDWFFVTDCTGDGADDLVRVYESGGNVACRVYASSGGGSSFSQSDWSPSGYAYVPDHRWYPGDYNGDGLGDFAVLRSESGELHVDMLLSTGSGFTVETNWVSGGTPYAYGQEMVYPGDFNGDGISDLVRIYETDGLLSADVFVSTGAELAGTPWISGQGDYQDEADIFLSDVDGDGKQDLVCVKRKHYQSVIDLYTSTGAAFIYHPDTYAQLSRFDSLRGGPVIRRHKYFDPHMVSGPFPPGSVDPEDMCRSGQDVLLMQGGTYVHTDAAASLFKARTPQQVIETFEAKTLDQFAVINRHSMTAHQLVAIDGMNSVLAQKIIGDGRRYDITAADVTAGFAKGGAHFFGGRNASYHRFNRMFAFNSVGQTAFKIQEANDSLKNTHRGNRIENCFVFGAGVDPRGNGRNPDLLEGWADAIGLTSRDTVIRNNVVIDGTDVGIVLFTAPDSIVEDNVVSAVSRSCLGGINLLDTLFYDQWGINGLDPEGRKQYDFSSLVQSNYIDARGARVDVGIPVGWRTWRPPPDPEIDNPYGIDIFNNELDGDAFGYGIAIANGFNITATGNVSTATHSGTGGYYMRPHLAPDPASAFAYAPLHTFGCTYGAEFSPASEENGLDFIIYNTKDQATYTPDGYIYTPYQAMEAVATVEMAYVEMLRRYPDAAELAYYTNSLISAYGRSDEIRLELMQSAEFDTVNPTFSGDKTINGMQLYRAGLWMDSLKAIDAMIYDRGGDIPAAKQLYRDTLSYLSGDYLPVGGIVMSPAPGGLNLEYEGALATSTNLQSWSVVAPQPGSPAVITPDDEARFFKAVTE